MKRIVIGLAGLATAVLFFACGVQETPEIAQAPFVTNFADAKAKVSGTEKNILIDFYTDW